LWAFDQKVFVVDENQKKKKYEKPQVTRIRLDARCAVLGFCKSGSFGGPVVAGCTDGLGSSCLTAGS
jgi:hypothetical protein